MFIFILCILAFAGGIIALLAGGMAKNPVAVRASGAVAIILALLVFFFSGFRSVPTKSIGVPTSFGHVESTLGSGFHWKMPWTTVNILDETIQTTTFEGTKNLPGGNPDQNECLDVRIGGQQTACLDVTIQWRILDSGAPGLYQDYSGQGSIMNTITDAVVIRELKQTVNDVLGDYNPIADVASTQGAGNSQFSAFGPVVLRAMRADLSGRIQVLTVLMPLLRYDSATQARLNQIQQQYGETAIAQQEIKTNQDQSAANAAISHSLTPASLAYDCLTITQSALKSGTSLPVGWNCFGSSSSLALTGK
jgi:regulator of protease activity HflC (stomatin/prohibitin superfamily)